MSAPTRPVLRWHGGKWRLAPWIIAHLPPHRVYVEPFGGAASVLLRKPRSYAEIYNDLDAEVVALFRVLQNPEQAQRLIRTIELTPFSRAEFELSYAPAPADNAVEVARRLIIRSYMGFGSNAHASMPSGRRSTGFRSNSRRTGSTPAHDWRSYPDALVDVIDRLRGVIIERRDAFELLGKHDGPDTLYYIDPPYMHDLRSPANKYDLKYRMYRHELDDAGHEQLLDRLVRVAGMVVVSGYPSTLYDAALRRWRRVEITAYADGARKRTEALWLNPRAAEMMPQRVLPFGDAGSGVLGNIPAAGSDPYPDDEPILERAARRRVSSECT